MTKPTAAPSAVAFEADDDTPTSPAAGRTFGDVLAERLSRRDLMSGVLASTAIAVVVSPAALLTACSDAGPPSMPNFSFTEVASGSDERHYVAEGYDADVLIRWGDKVLADAPPFDPKAQSADGQARQFGYNNDYIGYLPIDGSSMHGLLVVNHEYSNEELMFSGHSGRGGKPFEKMTPELVAVEMMAHGGSVIEVKREAGGPWQVVEGSRYARRITADTPMRLSGPAAGHERLKTRTDPEGRSVRGMLNNCSGAVTPWGTWLSCEENFNGYFWNKAAAKTDPYATSLQRYGAPGERYSWGRHHARFDIGQDSNEIHRFGWIVEIDPLDPDSTPIKRTALGRFKHEAAANIVNRDGRFVVYMGDDQRFDYVYRFVTKGKVDPQNRAANMNLLDEGTLYVARFDADGAGVWLPLEFGKGPLTEASGFRDQGEVMIDVRLAADLLGATKMDRPEDVEANPKTGKVYVMLTNNKDRPEVAVDAANPRAKNLDGHIIEMTPDAGDHTAPTFRWEILVRCGDPAKAEVGATFNPATSTSGWFSNPDNCLIDGDGRLWVATDGNSAGRTGRTDGLWAVETEGKARATSRLFFRCPVGAELCGPCLTPDGETMFVAVQHPGQSTDAGLSTYDDPSTRWPDFRFELPPRPAVVAITKAGGGKIGA
ncbi:MAG: PhoX family phosphatase [Hyphomicrobiaceae bacterium]|nr:PhoX family phosphatase [Hyphomicrobiaceae bacterium]